jgi:hypothetical protein
MPDIELQARKALLRKIFDIEAPSSPLDTHIPIEEHTPETVWYRTATYSR